MKPSKHISDEELAVYLDQILSNQNMPTNSMCDIETLEVLSVAREASKHITPYQDCPPHFQHINLLGTLPVLEG